MTRVLMAAFTMVLLAACGGSELDAGAADAAASDAAEKRGRGSDTGSGGGGAWSGVVTGVPTPSFGLACQGGFAAKDAGVAGVFGCEASTADTTGAVTMDLVRRVTQFTALGIALGGDVRPPRVEFAGVPAPGTYKLSDAMVARFDADMWFLADGEIGYFLATKNGAVGDRGTGSLTVTSIAPITLADGSASYDVHGSYALEMEPHAPCFGPGGEIDCSSGSVASTARGVMLVQGTF